MKILEGKNIIITGASRGIGKGIANLLSNHGANIAFTYHLSKEKAKELEKDLSTEESRIKGYKSDASNFKAAQQLAKDVLNDFGRETGSAVVISGFFRYQLGESISQ